ncbi:MAG: hypothetical protein CMN76_16810 [Spirochaetaceae bacterium]|nr:hypothetical protein [Spirochaetaceae bacterium]
MFGILASATLFAMEGLMQRSAGSARADLLARRPLCADFATRNLVRHGPSFWLRQYGNAFLNSVEQVLDNISFVGLNAGSYTSERK